MKPGPRPIPHRTPRAGRKNVRFTVVRLNGERATCSQRTPAGALLTDAGVQEMLAREWVRVEKWFPGVQFRLVALRDGNFNFVEFKKEFGGIASGPEVPPVSNVARQHTFQLDGELGASAHPPEVSELKAAAEQVVLAGRGSFAEQTA